MPVKTKKVGRGRYRVSTPGGVKAKATTKKKAQRQSNLLRGVDAGWQPTGRPARDKRAKPRRVKRNARRVRRA